MSKDLEERIKYKLSGLELSIECEEAVVRHLFINRRLFEEANKNHTEVTRELMSKVRQCLDSEQLIKNWQQEHEDLVNLLRVYKESQNHVCPIVDDHKWENVR